MIEDIRNQFNDQFSAEKYESIKEFFNSDPIYKCGFRISETPLFMDKKFGTAIYNAGEAIIDQLLEGKIITDDAIPNDINVPNKSDHYHFLAIDFGICQNQKGEIEPQLIELQAFPSLYFYQFHLANQFVKHYDIPENFGILPHRPFDGIAYLNHMRDLIVEDYDPQNVVLLEIEPKKQKTGIDFALTKQALGIKPVDIAEVRKVGNDLYYIREGVITPIYRIYNRVIFDELYANPDFKPGFDLNQEIDIEWITHPDWFFKISKYLLPKLNHHNVPKSYFANEFPADEDLSKFVLKPLFSFAGKGVIINVTQEDLDKLENPAEFILQRKVEYAPIFKDTNGEFAKAEIRLLYTWLPGTLRPELQINLTRMTKAEKVNVDHLGQEKIWTGSSITFFEH